MRCINSTYDYFPVLFLAFIKTSKFRLPYNKVFYRLFRHRPARKQHNCAESVKPQTLT